ncbi:MAG: hypothetical protein DMF31_07085, partial [Verrucomicrobia bacterium]
MTDRRKELDIEPALVPKIWDDGVAACLAKDPSRRPQSTVEVAQRLQLPSAQTRTSLTPLKISKRKPLLIAGVLMGRFKLKIIVTCGAAVLVLAGVSFNASKRHTQSGSHAPAIPE